MLWCSIKLNCISPPAIYLFAVLPGAGSFSPYDTTLTSPTTCYTEYQVNLHALKFHALLMMCFRRWVLALVMCIRTPWFTTDRMYQALTPQHSVFTIAILKIETRRRRCLERQAACFFSAIFLPKTCPSQPNKLLASFLTLTLAAAHSV